FGEEVAAGAAVSTVAGNHPKLLQAIFDTFRKLNIRVEVKTHHAEESIGKRTNQDLLLISWFPDYPDPDSFGYQVLHSQHGMVAKYCGVPEIDALVDRAR